MLEGSLCPPAHFVMDTIYWKISELLNLIIYLQSERIESTIPVRAIVQNMIEI